MPILSPGTCLTNSAMTVTAPGHVRQAKRRKRVQKLLTRSVPTGRELPSRWGWPPISPILMNPRTEGGIQLS